MRYRKKPVVIDATQWWQNGDHPEDGVGEIARDPQGEEYTRIEGAVVRFFRNPNFLSREVHVTCGRIWHDHGWVDTLEGGHTVCPGDWIITGVQGEYYPCKPDIFAATYEPVEDDTASLTGSSETSVLEEVMTRLSVVINFRDEGVAPVTVENAKAVNVHDGIVYVSHVPDNADARNIREISAWYPLDTVSVVHLTEYRDR